MTRVDFDVQLDNMLLSAELLIPQEKLPDLPFMESAPTVPDWYDFEGALWEIGEEIRQLILSERKDLNAEQADRICRICADTKAKRGRQSFVMLLGKRKFLPWAEQIATLLPDEDIDGHVISTLSKMGASQFVARIKPYTDHPITWIRNEAKRYIQKYGV